MAKMKRKHDRAYRLGRPEYALRGVAVLRDGRKMTYEQYLRTADWRDTRQRMITRYPMCQVCRTERTQHIHHLTYRRLGSERKEDLASLCARCHADIHRLADEGFGNVYTISKMLMSASRRWANRQKQAA